jgi:hypothetical protein
MPSRRLRKLLTGLMGVCLVSGATAAAAASPDMRGTWKMEAEAIVRGAVPFHPADAPPAPEGSKPRLRHFAGTLRIAGQDGARFWGVVENELVSEELIGSLTGEAGRFVILDVDGEFEGELLESGTIRYCYRHLTAGAGVIACGTMARE